jgi:hypothetical protein
MTGAVVGTERGAQCLEPRGSCKMACVHAAPPVLEWLVALDNLAADSPARQR